jgi:hypothetical protein
VVGQGSPDRVDLRFHPCDELRSVSAADVEAEVSPKEAADVAPFDAAAVGLGVDHKNTRPADVDVVDVCSAAGNSAVMENNVLL